MFFKNLNIPHIPFINTVAASCFGVLLIHANSDAMRLWLWVDTLKVPSVYAKALMPLHAVGSVLLVYAACTCIDFLRIRYLEKPFFRLWDRKVPEIAKKISK